MNETRRGILFFLAAWSVVPVIDVSAKLLGNWGYPVFMTVWGRFFFSLLILSPVLLTKRRDIFLQPPREAGKHVLRAFFLVAATLLFFLGLRTMPIVDALATYFVYPFLVTALSPLFLGEHPGWQRWSAVGLGFIGSLVVIRPSVEGLSMGVVYILGAAVAFAGYNLLTRGLSRQGDPWRTLTFQCLVGFAVTSLALPFYWQTPDVLAFSMFILMGASATFGLFLFIRAYDFAAAPVLAPFAYFEIVIATILGFAVFGDSPDNWIWAGVAVIVTSGVIIALRERRAPSDI